VLSPSRDLRAGRIDTVDGVPLAVLGRFDLVPETPLITRRNGERT
jgi:hypothetical protein